MYMYTLKYMHMYTPTHLLISISVSPRLIRGSTVVHPSVNPSIAAIGTMPDWLYRGTSCTIPSARQETRWIENETGI